MAYNNQGYGGDPQAAAYGYPPHQGGWPAPPQGPVPVQQPQQAAASPWGNYVNPDLTGAAMQIGSAKLQDMSNNVKGYIDIGKLKYYFTVDTRYVLSKLRLLVFPYTHTEWSRQGPKDEKPLPPREDINAPDLYIPVMSVLTYVLLVGFILGVSERFSPELLGGTVSSTFGWLVVEVFVYYAAFYLMSITSVGIFELIALCSYKYFEMIIVVLAYILTRSDTVYSVAVLFLGVSLMYFLVRTMHKGALPNMNSFVDDQDKRRLIVSIVIAVIQLFFIYWFTSYLVGMKPDVRQLRKARLSLEPEEDSEPDVSD